MECLDTQCQFSAVAYAKAKACLGSITVETLGIIVKAIIPHVIPLQGGVPLDVARAKHIGTCGGDKGINGVLCMSGGHAHDGHSGEEDQGHECRFIVASLCFFHCSVYF